MTARLPTGDRVDRWTVFAAAAIRNPGCTDGATAAVVADELLEMLEARLYSHPIQGNEARRKTVMRLPSEDSSR